MTAKEIVLGGYQNFAEGDLVSLAKIYHPECKITVNGKHKLSGVYVGFQEFAENFLSKLNETWPGFDLEIQKVVADTTDVCVFVKRRFCYRATTNSRYLLYILEKKSQKIKGNNI